MLDNLVSRKKEKKKNLPIMAYPRSIKKYGRIDMILIAVLCIVITILIYHFHTPTDVKKGHKAKVDATLESIADGISAKNSWWASQIGSLKKSIALDEEEKVSIEQHEEEVGKLNADIEEHKHNIGKLETTNKDLETTLKETQARIEEKEKRLKELEAAKDSITAGISLFCDACPFDKNNLRTSCGARAYFLMSHHGDEEQVAKEAVMKMDPNCAKKSES